MDPITAVGAVASIITLAQTALALSTTLYGLGSALLSASEDLKNLADDLKTFSQSLTLLSRLLEDSKSWYSDDIYLLTAKVIKDCADLYVKIDGILSKLGGKGKANWMKRMKYVMKETQIRKLLRRLRDLKGTLATILMSLQVDLQLSLLNISSSSKLQRAPEVPLQPNTIETLREAQEAVRRSRLLSVQAAKSDNFVHVHVEELYHKVPSDDRVKYPAALQVHQESMFMFQQASNVADTVAISRNIASPPRSLKSSSSSDSFKSAIVEQEPEIEIIREVEGVLHGFRTALEVLEKVLKRIDKEDKALRIEAERLNYSLTKGVGIHQAYGLHHQRHGKAYLSALRNSEITLRQLQDIMTNLMGELVTTLHMYSAAYEVLSPTGFQNLHLCSEKCRIRTLFELDRLAMLLFPEPVTLILVKGDLEIPFESVSLQKTQHEVHVTEFDIDERISVDYSYLISGLRGPTPQSNLSISANQGFCSWDSRASTLALPKMNDVAASKAPHPYPTIGDTQHRHVEKHRRPRGCHASELTWNGELESPTPGFRRTRDRQAPAMISTPSPALDPKSSKMPGAFDEDLDSTAPLTAGLDYPSLGQSIRTTHPMLISGNSIAVYQPDNPPNTFNLDDSGMFGMSMDFASSALGTADVLQDFDFDFFLHQDGGDKGTYFFADESILKEDREFSIVNRNNLLVKPPTTSESSTGNPDTGAQLEQSTAQKVAAELTNSLLLREQARGHAQMEQLAPDGRGFVFNSASVKQSLTESTTNTTSRRLQISREHHELLYSRNNRRAPRKSVKSTSKDKPAAKGAILDGASEVHRVHEEPASLDRAHGRGILNTALETSSLDNFSILPISLHGNDVGNNEHENYWGQLMLLEQQNKKRIAMAGVDMEHATSRHLGLPRAVIDGSAAPPPKRSRKNDSRARRHEKLKELKDEECYWWLAYISLEDTHPGDVGSLNSTAMSEMSLDLGQELNSMPAWDSTVMQQLLILSKDANTDPGLADADDHRRNIIKVIRALYESLGLANSSLAWMCVAVLLKIYHPVFLPSTTQPSRNLSSHHTGAVTKTFAQLDDIVSMVARYAVMENLYSQNPTMTLRADYKASLLALCCKILQWFVAAFKINIEGFPPQNELTNITPIDTIWEEIKAMDQACQRFTITIEAKEEKDSASEDESATTPLSGVDIEDTHDDDKMEFVTQFGRGEDRKLEAKLSEARGGTYGFPRREKVSMNNFNV